MEERPVNPLPAVAILIAAVMIAVEAVLGLAQAGIIGGPSGIGWRIRAIEDHAFSPVVWDWVTERGVRSLEVTRRFVTYAFVHGSVTEALFAIALTLALGKFTGEAMSGWGVLAVFLAGVIGGAAVFGIVLDGPVPLYGAWPGIYALIGAYTTLMWMRLGQSGENRVQAFRLIGVLLALQLVFGMLFGSTPVWIAELGGFGIGFGLTFVLAPGGWTALLQRLRARG